MGKANWVAWTLMSADMGDVPRTNKFKQDDSLPRGFVIADEKIISILDMIVAICVIRKIEPRAIF